MRKNLLLVLATAVSIMSCQNYDDQFNDLNSQITALASQVTGLSEAQGDLGELSALVSSLQTSVTQSGSALSTGLSSLQEQIDALTTQLSTVASSEDITNINDALENVREDLDDLLTSSNVFSGDLNINSSATLEFAQSLNSKVAIINGSVSVELNPDMDAAALQQVVGQIKTITKDLSVRAQNSSLPALKFTLLTGVNDLKIAQGESLEFPVLKSAGNITIGNNYESKLDGAINFGALIQVKKIITANIGDEYKLTDQETNTINLSKMASLDLGSLGYYSPRKLIISGDSDTVLNLSSLQSVDANGSEKSYDIEVSNISELNVPGLVLGTVKVTNVQTVKLEAFSGEFTLGSGVENVHIGALENGFDASNNNDLETLNLNMDAAKKAINLNNAEGLRSVSISGAVQSITLNGNGDLDTLEISAAVESLTVSNTNLSEVNLTYTNANLVEKGTLSITGNSDLTSFSADKVNGLAALTITGNSDLETISFDALKDLPTKEGLTPSVTIGGKGKANALNAESIVQEKADEGSFTTSSGIDDLKVYLTAAAKDDAATLKVFFDSADDFTYGAINSPNIKIGDNGNVSEGRLTVINRDGSSDAKKAKRAFLVTTLANGTLKVNNTSIDWDAGTTSADFVSNLLVPTNVAQLNNNGVTLTANSHGSPEAEVFTGTSSETEISGVGNATSQASAEKITLTIGDYSSTVYLSTETISDDEVAINADGKNAKTNFVVTNNTTTVSAVLNKILAAFGNPSVSTNTFSAYTVSNTSVNASGTLLIAAKDLSNAHHGKAIKFTASDDIVGLGKLSINKGVTEDDTLIGENPIIIIESETAGLTLSEIGSPADAKDTNAGLSTPATGSTGDEGQALLTMGSGIPIELFNTSDNLEASNSVTSKGVDSTTGNANTNNISWLAG